VVNDNSAAAFGGGIFNAGTLTMGASSLTYNKAGDSGGGLYTFDLSASASLTGTDIEYNQATNKGGGFYLGGGGSLTLTYSTLSNNTAPVGAGGAWATGSHYNDNGGNTITDQVVEVAP
jgi:hypothetical protein